jgi:acyl carrier protein
MENTFETVRTLIAEKLEIDKATITPDSVLTEIGLDSLDTFDIIFEAEDTFGINVPTPKEEIKTVQDVANLLDQLLNEQAPSLQVQK